jgi:hypothetical protein
MLSEALGSTYLFDFPEKPQMQVARGETGGQGGNSGQDAFKFPEGLQTYIDPRTGENITNGVYQKFAQLNTFANEMMKNRGIDVTQVDYSNPESVKAHAIYNKASADLAYSIDELKRGQKIIEGNIIPGLINNTMALPEGMSMSSGNFGRDASQYIRSNQLAESTKEANKYNAQEFSRSRDRAVAQGKQDALREMYASQMNDPNLSAAQRYTAKQQYIALGDPSQNLDEANFALAARKAGEEENGYNIRHRQINATSNGGDIQWIQQVPDVEAGSVKFNPLTEMITYRRVGKNGYVENVQISAKDVRSMNALANQVPGALQVNDEMLERVATKNNALGGEEYDLFTLSDDARIETGERLNALIAPSTAKKVTVVTKRPDGKIIKTSELDEKQVAEQRQTFSNNVKTKGGLMPASIVPRHKNWIGFDSTGEAVNEPLKIIDAEFQPYEGGFFGRKADRWKFVVERPKFNSEGKFTEMVNEEIYIDTSQKDDLNTIFKENILLTGMPIDRFKAVPEIK